MSMAMATATIIIMMKTTIMAATMGLGIQMPRCKMKLSSR